jgi:hypothetical protein
MFKYCKAVRARSVLEVRKIRFTPPSELNDPFELLPNLGFINHPNRYRNVEEYILKRWTQEVGRRWALNGRIGQPEEIRAWIVMQMRGSMSRNEPVIREMIQREILSQRQGFRILCLSTTAPDDKDAVLLWSHYAEGHHGCAIEFDPHHPWISAIVADDNGESGLVKYGEAPLSMEVDDHGNVIPNADVVFWKLAKWSYEREFRIVSYIGNRLLDRNRCDALAGIPVEMIRSVIFGAECEQQTFRSIVSVCSKPELRHIRLRRSVKDFESAGLSLVDI